MQIHEPLSLKDAARVLRLKPYQIGYAISVGSVPEPALRVGNRRIFQNEDLKALAAHFGTARTGEEKVPA